MCCWASQGRSLHGKVASLPSVYLQWVSVPSTNERGRYHDSCSRYTAVPRLMHMELLKGNLEACRLGRSGATAAPVRAAQQLEQQRLPHFAMCTPLDRGRVSASVLGPIAIMTLCPSRDNGGTRSQGKQWPSRCRCASRQHGAGASSTSPQTSPDFIFPLGQPFKLYICTVFHCHDL